MIMRYLLLALILSFSMANAQRSGFANLDKSPLDMSYARPDRMSDPDLRVLYSRPQLKGRTLESLAPKGSVWRTGANETTEIIFYKDMKIQGTKIPAGTYSLYTIPGESDWKVILNKKLHTWGAYSYDQSKDFGRFTAEVKKSEAEIEVLSIRFDNVSGGYHLVIGWGSKEVRLPISTL
jgi:hypothetical protein